MPLNILTMIGGGGEGEGERGRRPRKSPAAQNVNSVELEKLWTKSAKKSIKKVAKFSQQKGRMD